MLRCVTLDSFIWLYLTPKIQTPWLPQATFEAALAALPLVSVDWVLSNPEGAVLCGLRLNAPARGAWFTPGGRVHKGEALAEALQRVAMSELGAPQAVAASWLERTKAMGAWDHFYEDSAFSPTAATHYVNLPHALALTWAEIEAVNLPIGEQHGSWRWVPSTSPKGENHADMPEVHPYVKPYLAWMALRYQNQALNSAPNVRNRPSCYSTNIDPS